MMRRALITSAALMLAGCGGAGDTAANATIDVNATAATGNEEAVPVATAAPSTPPPDAPPAPAATSAPAGRGLAALAGAWTVSAVHVDTSGVAALGEDDPTEMGAVLEVGVDKLAWRPHPAGGTFDDVCTGPTLAADGTVACKDGQFGPPGAHLVAKGRDLSLDWYDGGTLTLRRAD